MLSTVVSAFFQVLGLMELKKKPDSVQSSKSQSY